FPRLRQTGSKTPPSNWCISATNGLAYGDRLKPILASSLWKTLRGWEKTIWRNLEPIVSILIEETVAGGFRDRYAAEPRPAGKSHKCSSAPGAMHATGIRSTRPLSPGI